MDLTEQPSPPNHMVSIPLFEYAFIVESLVTVARRLKKHSEQCYRDSFAAGDLYQCPALESHAHDLMDRAGELVAIAETLVIYLQDNAGGKNGTY